MQYLYLSEYDYYTAQSICESNHYAEIFRECIDDIVNNKNKYISKPLYTGWSYNPKLYNVNKNNIGIKLYIHITNINKPNGYILRRKSDKACIYISNKLTNIDIQSSIQHELIHIIKLYEPRADNGLNTLKETLSDEKYNYINEFNITYNYVSKNDREKIKKIYHTILSRVLYMFTENEQLATINAACKQIDVIDKNTVHDYLIKCINKTSKQVDDLSYGAGYTGFNISSQVINLSQYIKDIHLLPSLKKICNDYLNLPYALKMLIAFYLNKHQYIKPKLKYITYDTVYDALHTNAPDNININIKTELNKIQSFIKNNTEKYQKKLYNGIYAIMIKRKLFLDINEVCKIVPSNIKRLFEGNNLYYIENLI